MKKIFTLLFIMVTAVETAGAWGDLYLICEQNNNWSNTSYSEDFKFTCVAENYFRATVPGSYITTGKFYFRFRDQSSDTWQNISPESEENDAEITSNSIYSTNWKNSNKKSFYIAQNPDAKYVHIYCNYNTSTEKWDISCSVVTEQTTYNVAYINDTNWENVYVYAYLDRIKLTTAWPGVKLTLNDGVYKSTITGAENSRLIFNNGSSGDGNQSYTMDIINDGLYSYSEKIPNQNFDISSYRMSTFSSQYPLDFTGVEGISAYKITGIGENSTLTKEAVTKVPANTGLYIESTASGIFQIPTTATATSIGSNMLVAGTGAKVSQTDGDKTNYILTVNTVKGDVSTPRFYKVNTAGNTVSAGKAYLQIPTESAAREFFWFDNEAAGVDVVQADRQIADGPAYNLAGQRVKQTSKGLYIVGGKKVVR